MIPHWMRDANGDILFEPPQRIIRWREVLERFPRLASAAIAIYGEMPDDPRTIALSDTELVRLVATLCDDEDAGPLAVATCGAEVLK